MWKLAISIGLAALLAPDAFSGALLSPEDVLKQHGVEINKDSLISALGNPDERVVWAAAEKLADNQEKAAIPVMLTMLASSKTASTKVIIGGPLARLGEERGVRVLRETCRAKDNPQERLNAASYLLSLDHDDCLEDVLEVVSIPGGAWRRSAVAMLTRFGHLYKKRAEAVFSAVERLLLSEEGQIREEAGQVLWLLRDRRGVTLLTEAIGREKDEFVRKSLQSALHNLQGDLRRRSEVR